MADQKPSIGRIVHAVLLNRSGELVHRPAIITRTFGHVQSPDQIINARVFTDGPSDHHAGSATIWKEMLRYDATGTKDWTWHWPEVV